jgi:hypothetical protein
LGKSNELVSLCKILLLPLPTFLILGTLKADASRYTKARCVSVNPLG